MSLCLAFCAALALALGAAAPPGAAATHEHARPVLLAQAAKAGKPAAKKPDVVVMKTRDDFKTAFNADHGKVRIVAFLSPTCSQCIQAADQLQKVVLDANPDPDLVVHVVWLKVVDADSQERLVPARQVLHDARVRHYWDTQRLLNAMLLDAIMFDINLRLYDIFLLYERDAEWDKSLPRPPFWMHQFRGAPGPWWDATAFAVQVAKALRGEKLQLPR